MESLWIENRRNAISIETDPVFSTKPCGLSAALSGEGGRNLRILTVPSPCEGEATFGRIRSRSLDSRTDN